MLFAAVAQEVQRDVINAGAGGGFGCEGAFMSVAMQRQRGLVAIEGALQARTAEEGKDGLGLAHHRLLDRSVMGDGDLDGSVELGEPVIELDGLAFGDLHESLDPVLSKGHEFVGREPTAETLGASEAYTIHFVALPVEQVNSG